MTAAAPVTSRVAGHFGELLQGLSGGEVVLVTLPCAALGVTAAWAPDRPFSLSQPEGFLPEQWLAPIFEATTGRAPHGALTLSATLRRGGGCGGSTAAIVAVARALGMADAKRLAQLCHRLEGASDPLMLEAPGRHIWASRRAESRGRLGPLPLLEVVGGHLGPPERTEAGDTRFPDVSDLLDALRAGPDAAGLAGIGTTSALRNAALRRPGWLAPIEALVAPMGALGLVAAHTGSACGLLFAPGQADRVRVMARLAEAGVCDTLFFQSGGAA